MARFPSQRVFKSAVVNWAAGQVGTDLPLLFLAPARSQTARIADMRLRISVSVSTGAGAAAAARLFARILQRVVIKDAYGVRVDLKGSSLRCVDFLEYENFFITRNLGAGAGPLTVTFYLRIPLFPDWAARPQDFRWSLNDLLGGSCQLDFNAAALLGEVVGNQMTIASGTVELHVTVIDEGKDEQKSRICWRDFPITGASQVFPVRGRLVYALQYIGEVGENAATPAAWAAQNLSSRSLDLTSTRGDYLVDEYQERVRPRRAAPSIAAEDSEDPVVTGSLQPIFTPRTINQPTTELPQTDLLDWSTDLAFGAGTFVAANLPRMIISYVEDRPGDNSEGAVKTADGKLIPKDFVAPDLKGKLPSLPMTAAAG